jgi:hypothetical protein
MSPSGLPWTLAASAHGGSIGGLATVPGRMAMCRVEETFPPRVSWTASHTLHSSMGQVTRLTALWSCSSW